MRLRGRRVAAASVLVLGLASPVTQATACPDPDEEPFVLLYADTLTVTVRPGRTTYRPGDKATVRITVERRGPAGLAREPVRAHVKATVRTPNGVERARFVFTLPKSGTKTRAWQIPKGARPGPMEIETTALVGLVPSASCYSSLAYERGHVYVEEFLTVAR